VGKWLTPDTPSAGFICRTLRIPNSEDCLAIVNGALADLAYARSFEEYGDLSPEDTAALFAQMYEDYIRFKGCMIGTIFAYVTAAAPEGSLPCDGGTYLKFDYPLLYAALDSAYIVNSTQFSTPDLRGRGIIGTGTGSGLTARTTNQSGGEEAHALSVAELASHNHSYNAPSVITVGTGPVLVPYLASQVAATTGSSGSGTAHNNMQPWRALNYGIWAE